MKNLFLAVFITIFFLNICAQESNFDWYEKDGKLYYNKNLPVYLWISTSPDDNSKDILMTSQTTKSYVNPMYFDTEGYNTLRTSYAVDTNTKKVAYPSKQVIFKVYADGYAPTISAHFSGIRKYYTGAKAVYKSGLKIKLYAKDYISGVENIYYSINNSEFRKYNNPVEFNENGSYCFKFYALDNTGNKSEEKEYNFEIKQ